MYLTSNMLLNNSSKKVVVGMSGGVDSSVAAWLLKQQGYQVEGVFMKNWEEDDSHDFCASAKDLADATSVCAALDITLHTVNFSAEYWDNVFTVFLSEYQMGRTPNPDVLCNKEIKFKLFLEFAIEDLKADLIATGHYVRQININGQAYLARGVDKTKDQSYFLYTLSYTQLQKCIFPLGNFVKTKVRKIAKKLNLVNAMKKGSTGICFIGNKLKFRKFLSRYLPINPGNIIADNGKILGIHQGLMYYTLGQRKGLKIGGIRNSESNDAWYVVEKDVINNVLVVAQGKNNCRLFAQYLVADDVHWVNRKILKSSFNCLVKTRYQQPDISCFITPISDNKLKVVFDYPVRAVTPGQSIVFYLSEFCIGGGIIQKYGL